MAYGLQTYQDGVRREDLLDIIQDVSPDSNPLSTMLATTTATQTLHEWPEDYLARPTTVSKAVEGAAATYSDLTQPGRRVNITQIISTTFRVSGTERDVDIAGMSDPLDYQANKQLKDWKNKLEFSLIRATMASGDSGVAREMAGIGAAVTSHHTALLSGSSLSETVFNNFASDVWSDVGNDDVFDLVFCGPGLRQKISTFTAGSTRYVDASDKRLTRPVMVYESDFGVHRIMAHKDAYNSTTTPGPSLYMLKEDKFRIAYLRRPKREMLAKDGDRDNGQIVGEATLEYLAERTSQIATGFNLNG